MPREIKGDTTLRTVKYEKEYEQKTMLNESQYCEILEKLITSYSSKKYIQVNYYYDTQNYDIWRNNKTIRVRFKNDKLEFQIKNHLLTHNNTVISDETIIEIDVLPQIIEYEGQIVNKIGELVTERYDFYCNDYVISLDKNFYLGSTDYEIEIESISGNPILFTQQLQNLFDNIDNLEEVNGKYTRFIKKQKELNKNGFVLKVLEKC